MIHKSIQYWETFPMPNGGWRKLVVETLIEPGDTVRDAFYAGQSQVRGFHYESNKVDEKKAAEVKELEKPDTNLNRIQAIQMDILATKDLTELETFSKIATTSTDLQRAYNIKLNQFKP